MTGVGGEAPGLSHLELLRDPAERFLTDAREFADVQFREYQSVSLDAALPAFTFGLTYSRALARSGFSQRADMPVLDESDLADLKVLLTDIGIENVCDVCSIRPADALPTQRQIYVDKSVGSTAKVGVEKTLAFLSANHLVITQDGKIVDGHHRWLTACLINVDMDLPAFRIPAPLEGIMETLLKFSDQRHERNQ